MRIHILEFIYIYIHLFVYYVFDNCPRCSNIRTCSGWSSMFWVSSTKRTCSGWSRKSLTWRRMCAVVAAAARRLRDGDAKALRRLCDRHFSCRLCWQRWTPGAQKVIKELVRLCGPQQYIKVTNTCIHIYIYIYLFIMCSTIVQGVQT